MQEKTLRRGAQRGAIGGQQARQTPTRQRAPMQENVPRRVLRMPQA
jgi:hypothetical protein